MARSRNSDVLHIGVGSHVVAIRMSSGEELWRTKLKGSSFVTVYREGNHIFAGASGELFCLDAASGEIQWHNKLKGLGTGLISFASTIDAASSAAMSAQMAQQAALTATIAAT